MNEKQINNFLEEFEEQNLQKKWTDIIILPFDDKWKDKEQEILNLTSSDIVEQLSSFFKDRFLIDIDLSSKFDKTISDILSEDFFFLDHRDIQYNLNYII